MLRTVIRMVRTRARVKKTMMMKIFWMRTMRTLMTLMILTPAKMTVTLYLRAASSPWTLLSSRPGGRTASTCRSRHTEAYTNVIGGADTSDDGFVIIAESG